MSQSHQDEYIRYWIERAALAEDTLRGIDFAVGRRGEQPVAVVAGVNLLLDTFYERNPTPLGSFPPPPGSRKVRVGEQDELGTVEPGEVRVSRVDLVLSTPDVRVWHIDLHSKYARIAVYDRTQIMLYADDNTLSIDRERKGFTTTVHLDVPDDDGEHTWFMLADCIRHTCTVVAYRVEDSSRRSRTTKIHPSCVCTWEAALSDGFVMTERKAFCLIHGDEKDQPNV
jgi:hypothetical protein